MIRNKITDRHTRMLTYTILVGILVCFALFTYGRAHIQGDSAQSIRYANAILDEHSLFPKEWSYGNGEFYVFNSLPFVVLFCLFIGNKSLAIVLGTLATLLVAVVSIILVSEKVLKSRCWTLIIPIFLIFLSSPESRYMIIYMGAYVMEMTALTLVFYFLYRALKSHSIHHLVLHSVFLFIMILGGSRYLAEYTLPALLAFVFAYYMQIRDKESVSFKADFKYIGKILLYVLLPSLVGFIAYKYLSSTHTMVGNGIENLVLEDSIEEVFANALTAVSSFFAMFGYNGGVSVASIAGLQSLVGLVICIIVCFVIPILQAVKIKNESQDTQLYFTFGVAHNLVLFMVAVLCGKNSERYLLSSAYVWIIISARYLYTYLLDNKKYKAVLWEALFVVAIFVEGAALIQSTADSSIGVSSYAKICDALKEHNLSKGYATYWVGYPVEVYSNNDIKIGGGSDC